MKPTALLTIAAIATVCAIAWITGMGRTSVAPDPSEREAERQMLRATEREVTNLRLALDRLERRNGAHQ